MARRDVKLIGSLVDYVHDVKPYHTKLREFASEILFKDTISTNIVDDHHVQIHMKNMWTRDDLGCSTLSIMSEGTESDRYFKLPAAIWPHFSLNDNFPLQSPLGDDPVAQPEELVDSDNDGVPDYDDPWTRDANTSHFPGSDWIPVPAVISGWSIHLTEYAKRPGTGENLVSNGYFDIDVGRWNTGGNASATISNNTLRVTNLASDYGYVKQSVTTVPGKKYIFYNSRVGGTGLGLYQLMIDGADPGLGDNYAINATATSQTFIARGHTVDIWLAVGGNTQNDYYEWDAIELFEYTANDVYRFAYDLEISVDGTIEDAYGLGNYYQAFIDGNDVTYKTSRDDVVGAFDTDEFEDDTYDSVVRSFTIKKLRGWLNPSADDIATFPELTNQVDAWVAQFAYARYRPKVELFYTNTGRYHVPFHQGARVYVDGNLAVFGSSYIVESRRDFIQFLRGRHPRRDQTISVNTMCVDRMFISQTFPFDVNPTVNVNSNWIPFILSGFDETTFEDLAYDIGLPDQTRDYFTFKIDDSYPKRVSPVSFMNSTLTDGKATLTITEVNPAATNGEIYMVYATGPWTFAVQQIAPVRLDPLPGRFKQPFSNGKVSFIVDKTWTPYYMVPDPNSYSSFSTVYDVYEFKAVDQTDHLLDLSLKMEHGAINDPTPDGVHRPVEFANIGKVRKVIDTNAITKGWIGVETFDLTGDALGAVINDVYPGSPADDAGLMIGDIILSVDEVGIKSATDLLTAIDAKAPGTESAITILRGIQTYSVVVPIVNQVANSEFYQFVLNQVPPRGVYYELRLEQTGGLNPNVHAAIDDCVVITVLEDSNNFMYTEVYDSRNPGNPDVTNADADPIVSIGDTVSYLESGYVDEDYVD